MKASDMQLDVVRTGRSAALVQLPSTNPVDVR